VSEELAAAAGFALRGSEPYTHLERMTPEQFTAYLLTQTNVTSAVDTGATSLDDAAAWIAASVTPFFQTDYGTLKFSGGIWYLQR
jgi:hypothetical protein